MPTGKPSSLQHTYRTSLLRIDPQRSSGTARQAHAPAGEGWACARSPAAGEAGEHADPRRALGLRGEDLAAAHFKALGFRLLARNQYRRFGELDLVVFDGHTLVFVEVKTTSVRRQSVGSEGYEQKTLGWPRIKQFQRQRRAVSAWLAEHGSECPDARCRRLDVVKISFDERHELVRLDHIEGAWEGAW
jgi:putative endonuclease